MDYLTKDQEGIEVKITAKDAVIALQVIARLVETRQIRDTELATVGACRQSLLDGLQAGAGVNFDAVRAEIVRFLEQQMKTQQAQLAAVEQKN